MLLHNYYPRRVGDLFFLVNTRSSEFLQVNEIVFDLVSSYRDGQKEDVIVKYNLTSLKYEEIITEITRGLHET